MNRKTKPVKPAMSVNPGNPTKATRKEIRIKTERVNVPRQSLRPLERSRQPRAHTR